MQTHRHNGTRLKPSTLHGERLVAAYACEVIDGVIVRGPPWTAADPQPGTRSLRSARASRR